MSTTTPETTERNGVDVAQLTETIGAIRNDPAIATFRFRAGTEWLGGGHSRTTVKSFYGAGAENTSRATPFTLDGDEPGVLLGGDRAPNAVEAVLHALTSCLTVGFVYNAAARGIEVRSLDLDVEGELDLHGFLGLSETTRPGYQRIDVRYRVDADATEEQVEQLCDHVQRTSPVLDIVTNPVQVTVARATEDD